MRFTVALVLLFVAACVMLICVETPMKSGAYAKMFCYKNIAVYEDSNCRLTVNECELGKEVARKSFAKHGVPFEADDCHLFDHPFCFQYRIWHEDASVVPHYRCSETEGPCLYDVELIGQTSEFIVTHGCEKQ